MLNELKGCVQRLRSWARKRECYLCPVGSLVKKKDIRVAWRLKSLFWYLQRSDRHRIARHLRQFGEALDVGPCVRVGK